MTGHPSECQRGQTQDQDFDDGDSESVVRHVDAVYPGIASGEESIQDGFQILSQIAAAMIGGDVPGKIAAPTFEESTGRRG
jgi:hypothetical protein